MLVAAANVIDVAESYIKASFTVSILLTLGKSCRTDVWLDCNECLASDGIKGHFDLCNTCYETDGGCKDTSHILSRFIAFDKTETYIPTDEGYCDVPDCHKKLSLEEVHYNCSNCKLDDGKVKGVFAVCRSCYGSGAGCLNRSHRMTRCTRG